MQLKVLVEICFKIKIYSVERVNGDLQKVEIMFEMFFIQRWLDYRRRPNQRYSSASQIQETLQGQIRLIEGTLHFALCSLDGNM